jgi:hypothetical protein
MDSAWRGHGKEPQRRAGGKAAGIGELVRPNLHQGVAQRRRKQCSAQVKLLKQYRQDSCLDCGVSTAVRPAR